MLASVFCNAGSHYYEGQAFFVTGLNKTILAANTVQAKFAVRPPSMMCGVYGIRDAEIRNFDQAIRKKAKEYLEKEHGPALAIFFSSDRTKLFDEYSKIESKEKKAVDKLPEALILGDSKTETYEFGILTGKGFFVYKEGEFVRSYMKDYGFRLEGLLRYREYLEDLRKPFYPSRWGCVNF